MRGTRDTTEVEKGERYGVKDQSAAEGRGRRRALTQHSGPDCGLSTSPNCGGQTLSVSALRWITEMLWRGCLRVK